MGRGIEKVDGKGEKVLLEGRRESVCKKKQQIGKRMGDRRRGWMNDGWRTNAGWMGWWMWMGGWKRIAQKGKVWIGNWWLWDDLGLKPSPGLARLRLAGWLAGLSLVWSGLVWSVWSGLLLVVVW
jgi:hypothetical protein